MPKRRYLDLSPEQHAELVGIRDRHPKPYMREKAAILLKIANGMSPHAASQSGGLRPHDSDTVYRWMDRYEEEGTAGLAIKAGRGRKPKNR